jgi:glycosyltransferase A (GT-A) superfamily protein (DUF2064 family)
MSGKVSEVFSGVTWGTENVLDETLERLKGTDVSLELLPIWYDVDSPDDLKFLKTHLELITHSGLCVGRKTKIFLDGISF